MRWKAGSASKSGRPEGSRLSASIVVPKNGEHEAGGVILMLGGSTK